MAIPPSARAAACAMALVGAALAPPAAAQEAPPIINGEPESGFPEVVALGTDALGEPTALCTASVIAPRVLLTAAHCTEFVPVELLIVAGLAYVGPSLAEADIQHRLKLADVVLHPDYVPLEEGGRGALPEYDLSVIVLAEDAPVRPVWWRAGPIDDDDLDADLISVGYGVDERNRSGVKRSAPLVLGDYDEQFLLVYNADTEARSNICSGDSGGPQLGWDEALQGWVQWGVHSWGDSQCRSVAGSTRTDIAAEWILDQIEAVHGTRDRCEANGWRGDGACDPICAFDGGVADPDCHPPALEPASDPPAEKAGCAAAPGVGAAFAWLPALLVAAARRPRTARR